TTTKSASTGPQGAEASKQTTYTDSKTGATATTTKGTGTGRQVSYNNPTTGKSGSYSAPKEANNAYASKNGNVYKPSSSGSGWRLGRSVWGVRRRGPLRRIPALANQWSRRTFGHEDFACTNRAARRALLVRDGTGPDGGGRERRHGGPDHQGPYGQCRADEAV